MVIYVVEEQTWWTNGNDIGNEGIWIWPIKGDDFSGENATVYTNWYPGNASLRCITTSFLSQNISFLYKFWTIPDWLCAK